MYSWIVEKRKNQILILSIIFPKTKFIFFDILLMQPLIIIFPVCETWNQIHNDVLPNYLKTFNYKSTWNLMPVT